jgi:DUF917 family protein
VREGGEMTELADRTDVDDFLRGANFLSCCGGGDPAVQRELLYEDLERGLSVGWTDLVPRPDVLACTACFSGSIAPGAFVEPPEVAELAPGDRATRPLVEAVLELERALGQEVGLLVSTELGGINTGAILDVAANLGKPLVDGDYAGRAIPELNATTLEVHGVSLVPWAFADRFGNRAVLREAASNAFAERLGKFLAQGVFGLIGSALAPLPASDVARVYIPGTLTQCLELGRAIRVAREEGRDPVRAAAEALGGWVLFRGTLTGREWEDQAGYMVGFHEIRGDGEHEGHTLRIWFKNENHLSWLDGRPFVCSPDLLEVCDGESGEPLVNTYLAEGARVAVVGFRRRQPFDCPEGLAALGPRHFGWDVPFTPIEDLVGA